MALCSLPTHCPVLGSLRYVVGLYPLVVSLPKGAAPSSQQGNLCGQGSLNRQEVESSAPVRFLRRVGQPQSPGFGPSAWLQLSFLFARERRAPERECLMKQEPLSHARAKSRLICHSRVSASCVPASLTLSLSLSFGFLHRILILEMLSRVNM